MRHRRLLALAALLAGCGGAPAATATTTPAAIASAAPAREPRGRDDDEQASRIRELESRLALRSAEVRDLRGELEERREPQREVVRIGGRGCDPRAGTDVDPEADPPLAPHDDAAPDERESAGGPRPVLRLYGPPQPSLTRPALAAEGVTPFPGSQAPAVVPPPPQVAAFGRLPAMITPDVPAIPEQPIAIAPMPPLHAAVPPPPRAPEDDPIVREYQSALVHVEARRWDAALAALSRFVAAHPDHPYADNALYWQGQVHYARREYRRAIEILGALVARYPHGNKVADALLRIGESLEQLGDRDGARAYFRRVREQYPDTVAARMASREET